MLKVTTTIVILTLAALAVSAPLSAQSRSAVTSADLESAVRTAPGANQASVQQFLRNDAVIDAAAGMGVNVADLAARVSTMDEAILSQVADRTRAADRALAGGDQKVVLGTTAILLIIIIIILLAS
ncbi:MAG: PA2779 family protein [Gemmatimonadota bacterium]|nr:PA2779 family protein [Gemmatimonadota bacterium]